MLLGARSRATSCLQAQASGPRVTQTVTAADVPYRLYRRRCSDRPSRFVGERLSRNGAIVTHLTLRFLGRPEVLVAGDPLVVDTRKAIALLARLAVEGEQRREQVAGLLWPDSDRARARAALRRTLSVTTKSLGGVSLDAGGDLLAIPRSDVVCDLWAFEGHIARVGAHGDDATCPTCLDALEEAVALRRGGFLEAFSLRACPEFEQWQGVHDERLRRHACDALDWLVRGHAVNGMFDAATSFAQRRLAIDVLHERTYRQLMLLHAWSGRRTEAVDLYRQCVATFSAELGVTPLDETTRLYERLVGGDVPPPPPAGAAIGGRGAAVSSPTSPPPARAEAPLVGRSTELKELVDAFESTGPDGHVVVVEGEAGIGKTRLCDELVAHARRRGALILTARCHEDERRQPHAPVVELIRVLSTAAPKRMIDLPDDDLRELARLVPDVVRHRPGLAPAVPLDAPEARRRFQEVVSRVLSQHEDTRVLVVVDDLHNADRASLTLLTHLARRLEGRSLCLVVTWRPDASASDRLARHLLTDRPDDARRITIRPRRLSREDVGVLVARAPLDRVDEIGDRLHAETEGLPLLVVEYLAALEAQPEDWRLPMGARQRLLARLDSVHGVPREVLTTAAVIGRVFDLDLVQRASGRTLDEVGAALEQLVAGGLLRQLPGVADAVPRWDFGHNKMRQLVYEQASLARRRRLHARVAEAMQAQARDAQEVRSVAALLAHHERLAGNDREAAFHHRVAAEHARSVLAFADAREHLEAALALGEVDAAGLHEQLGDLHTVEADYVAALSSYETAAAHLLDDPARRAAVEQKLAGVHLRRGDRLAADAHLGAALHLVGDTGELAGRARILADRSLASLRNSDPHEAEALASEALELASAAKDEAALAQVHNLLAMVARRANRMADARRHARESLELSIALGDQAARIAATNNLALVERASGDSEAAITLLEDALERCRLGGDRHLEAALANNLADALYDTGRRDEAMVQLKHAVARFAEVSDPDVLRPEIWKLVDW